MKIQCMVNGQQMPVDQAFLGIEDLAVRRGYGVFDFFRVHDGCPLYLNQHLDRFLKGAAKLRLAEDLQKEELQRQIFTLIRANAQPGISAIRLVLTGGYAAFAPISPNLIITQEPLLLPSDDSYTNGVKVMTHHYLRELPEVKSISYLTAIYLFDRMKEINATEILYYFNDLVSECTRSNIFLVNDGKLLTPEKGMLEGVTRRIVIGLAEEYLPVRIKDISLSDVIQAEEVFITSTIKRILPVTMVDDHLIHNGKPGLVTRRLMQTLAEHDRQEESRVNAGIA